MEKRKKEKMKKKRRKRKRRCRLARDLRLVSGPKDKLRVLINKTVINLETYQSAIDKRVGFSIIIDSR